MPRDANSSHRSSYTLRRMSLGSCRKPNYKRRFRTSLLVQRKVEEKVMAKQPHEEAASHHEKAAKAHRTAAEHRGKGNHDEGKKHSATAHEHSSKAHEASKAAH